MKSRVIFLLDRSGSMQHIIDDTMGGFNTYLEELQKGDEADEMTMTRVQFDNMSIDTEFKDQPIKSVPGLDRDNFQPRGSTPLLEAAIKTIEAASAKEFSGKTVFVIMTDGQENTSKPEYTNARLSDLIAQKYAEDWRFVFLGAGIDAYAQAQAVGIGAGSTMSYNARDAAATKSGYTSLAANTRSFAAGQAMNMDFSTEQKRGAGDKFAEGVMGRLSEKKPEMLRTPDPRKVDL